MKRFEFLAVNRNAQRITLTISELTLNLAIRKAKNIAKKNELLLLNI